MAPSASSSAYSAVAWGGANSSLGSMLAEEESNTSLGAGNGGACVSRCAALTRAFLAAIPLPRDAARTTFFQRTGIPECDIDIVVNLAELIKVAQDESQKSGGDLLN